MLDAVFQTEASVFSGGLDNAVKRIDVATTQATVLGTHNAAVRCIEWLPTRGLVASAGWDSTLRLWDPRAAPGSGPTAQLTLPGKAFSMSASDAKLVVATSGRRIEIYDLRTLGDPGKTPEQSREYPLKFQTRCVRSFPNGQGYAVSSVEGRVGIEYFDLSKEIQDTKYAFKCHRKVEGGKDVIYPVNALAFNTKYGTFATGGCDGVVSIWDGVHKKRIHQITGYPTSIAALAFNSTASVLAVAASYTYERGESEHPPDAIYLRQVVETEVLPRQRQQK